MADNFRYRYGETDPILLQFKSTVAVAVGDLVYMDDADSNTVKPASSVSFGSAQAAPSAPTVTDGGVAVGSLFTTATWHFKVSYTTTYGESAVSTATAVSMTSGHAAIIAAITLPAGVTGLNIYGEDTAGSGNYYLLKSTKGAADILIGPADTGAPAAPGASTLTALAATQFTFASKFAGVSAQRYDGTNTTAYGIKDGWLRIDTQGVYDYPCTSATFNPGDLVGPDINGGSNGLLAQQVVKVANRALAIGRVVPPSPTNSLASTTTVRIEIWGTKNRIGVNPQPLP